MAIGVIAAVSLAAAGMSGSGPAEVMPPQNVPGYYVAVGPTSSKAGATYVAVIRRTDTGQPVATIRPPRPYTGFSDVSGAADDRTFVVTAQTTNGGANSTTVAKLYLLRFNQSNRAVRMSAVAIPDLKIGLTSLSIALSPDGTELAVGTTPLSIGGSGSISRITLYSVAGGTVLGTWQASGQLNIDSMGWARGGILDFGWTSYGRDVKDGSYIRSILGGADGLRLLNTTAGSGSLLTDSKHVYCPVVEAYGFTDEAFLTPDGTRILAMRTVPVEPGQSVVVCNKGPNEELIPPLPYPKPAKYSIYASRVAAPSMEMFSAATGRALRVIYRSPSRSLQPYYWVSWSNPDGSVLVINAPTTTSPYAHAHFGVLRDGKFALLPGSLNPEYITLAF